MSFKESTPRNRIKFKFSAYVRELRVKQWTKNLIIFAAPLFAFDFTNRSLSGSLIAFILFCCASSSFYLINDIIDVESDRLHPVKCQRPIAAGTIGISEATTVAIILLSVAAIVGYKTSFGLGTAIVGYALLQVAYNLKLKHKIFVDVLAIAAGFVLRAWGGAAATSIGLSQWFILCTAMLALFLAIEKRKAELRLSEIKGRKSRAVLHRYSLPLLNRMESIVTNGTIVFYSLWSAGPAFKGATTSWMMLTVPFVLYGIFRYQLLSDPQEIARTNPLLEQGGKTERPEEMLLKDRPLLLTAIGWLVTVFAIQLCYKLQWIH
ncbi:decaprenyl-phosphate phosphoribosyltransferase [Chamaesiphon sp.]|uniref:decaprenyl-phosphate phosphoribosyltransferase n=1 Tax=Chamaesiphon sp. TaxID=2814140 RepID=UPI0035943709